MLTGKKLGLAIREAIELKLAAGSAKTKKQIADHFGVKPPSLHDWIERGTIGKDKLVEMFQYFSDVVGPEHWGLSENFQAANTSPGPDIHGSVPLIDKIQAGNYVDVIDGLQPGEGERIDTTVPVKRYTYALRVEGDSMEPVLPEGSILIVEPEIDPQHGDYVIVKNGEAANVKQLIRDGSDWYLKPENPRYPIKPFPKDAVICGVVRGMERRFR